jgi:integrase
MSESNSKVATKLPEVTPSMWETVNPKNRKMVEEYIAESTHLSPYSRDQYTSALHQYFWWIKENANDKNFWEIRSKDYLFFQNFLVRRELSSSAIKLKRSVISSFNTYIETYYLEEFPSFRSYITKRIPAPAPNKVFEKVPLTPEEYENLCQELEKRELYEMLAYLKFSYSSGCRRNEVRQLKKEVITYEPKIKEIAVKNENGIVETKISTSYLTHDIRCKGRGVKGKVRKLQFDSDAMDAIKKWLEIRGEDDNPYVFVSKHKGEVKQVSENTPNIWAETFSEIVGRRVHPHLLRSSRATNLSLVEGKNISIIQKLLGHESSQTTQGYIVDENEDASDEAFTD